MLSIFFYLTACHSKKERSKCHCDYGLFCSKRDGTEGM